MTEWRPRSSAINDPMADTRSGVIRSPLLTQIFTAGSWCGKMTDLQDVRYAIDCQYQMHLGFLKSNQRRLRLIRYDPLPSMEIEYEKTLALKSAVFNRKEALKWKRLLEMEAFIGSRGGYWMTS